MPEHSPIINVRIDACGDHSWNTAYGAYTVPIPIPYGKYLLLLNPNWHELRKQEKCLSLAPPRRNFYKTQ